ncbi:MAG: iron-containing redox enzyme family protein [Blastocatellia bacterium AA13]|nr:MAG: iron-containing redox enzyme family protein [Blastocatellia bacterium AA13]
MLDILSQDSVRSVLIDELEDLTVRGAHLSTSEVGVILGQWYYPLHYFPVFLSRLVSVTPTIEMQSVISKILWQELGQGDPRLAHEKIYIETMIDSGFEPDLVASSPAFDATADLVRGYERSSAGYLTGLGFLYGTEVADLPMVSSIGALVRNCTNRRSLPWVDIHIEQEPAHVEASSKTLLPTFPPEEQAQIVSSAEELWSLWTGFFAELKKRILH